jgi:outer membrane protein assembly factor BamA
MAKMYKTPKFISHKVEYLAKGITAHPIKLIIKVIIGESIKINLLELLGITVSFDKKLESIC